MNEREDEQCDGFWLTLACWRDRAPSAAPRWRRAYPNRTVRIVVPYAPGGGVSILAQIVGSKMQELMKQPVVIDNRPGAGGNLGADLVAKSPPDGYTILMHTSAMASAVIALQQAAVRSGEGFRAGVHGDLDAIRDRRLAEKSGRRICRSWSRSPRKSPAAYNFGSSGPGSSLHLFAEMFNSIAGIKMVHIPYRGDAPMVTALIAGDIQLAFLPQANGIANVQSNLIRGLGVTGTKRMEALPDVPTAQEQGIKGLEVGSWVALFAPAGTPPDIVQTIQQSSPRRWPTRRCANGWSRPARTQSAIRPRSSPPLFKADIERFAKVIEQTRKIQKLDLRHALLRLDAGILDHLAPI